MTKRTELKRYYVHGDVVEGRPKTFYDARIDAFIPRSRVDPITPLDVDRLRYQLRLPRKTVPKNYTRPADPPNVFASHELMFIHGRRLKTLVREFRSKHGDSPRDHSDE